MLRATELPKFASHLSPQPPKKGLKDSLKNKIGDDKLTYPLLVPWFKKDSAERGNIQCGWKRRRWRRILSWIKTSKIHNRRILATKTITNCWCSKNRFYMKSKRQQSAIKHFGGAFFIHKFDWKLRAKRTPTYISSSYLSLKKIRIFMCERDCENKKLVITKFSLFSQTPNSNFLLSANRA